MSNIKQQIIDQRIRDKFGLLPDEKIQAVVINLYNKSEEITFALDTTNKLKNHTINQSKFKYDRESFNRFCALFSQGVQFVHRKFPDCVGIKNIRFEHRNTNFSYVDNQGNRKTIRIGNNPMYYTSSIDNDMSLLVIPLEYLANLLYMINLEATDNTSIVANYLSKGIELKDFSELVFILGVEEAYHAVQRQDKATKERIEKLEEENKADQNALSGANNVREKDVVPVLEEALLYFRNQQQQRETPRKF